MSAVITNPLIFHRLRKLDILQAAYSTVAENGCPKPLLDNLPAILIQPLLNTGETITIFNGSLNETGLMSE